jgi:hypothetical protein
MRVFDPCSSKPTARRPRDTTATMSAAIAATSAAISTATICAVEALKHYDPGNEGRYAYNPRNTYKRVNSEI